MSKNYEQESTYNVGARRVNYHSDKISKCVVVIVNALFILFHKKEEII